MSDLERFKTARVKEILNLVKTEELTEVKVKHNPRQDGCGHEALLLMMISDGNMFQVKMLWTLLL